MTLETKKVNLIRKVGSCVMITNDEIYLDDQEDEDVF